MKKTNGFVKVPRGMIGEATGNECLVYIYLASLPSFNKQGAYPSAGKIAEATGLSHNTVDAALRGLRSKGFLQSVKHGRKRCLSAPKNGVGATPKIGVE